MRLVFRVHAVERMFQHGVGEERVRQVLEDGETIREYPDDRPYPGRLVLGWNESGPLHVVAADNVEDETTFVITVDEPDPWLWESDFRRKRP